MPKMLADEDDKLVSLATAPADKNAVTATEGNAGEDWSTQILADPQLGPTGSSKVNMPAMGEPRSSETFGKSGASGEIVAFRYFTVGGQPDVAAETAFQASYVKGTELHLVRRTGGKLASEDFAADDEYSYFKCITDDPILETGEGWRRYRIPLAVSDMALNKLIVAGV